jgi:hypothetical protein
VLLVVTLAIVLGAGTEAARAQEGPLVIGRQEQRQVVGLENIGGSVDLLYRGQRDSSTSSGQESTSDEDLFRETLTLHSTGYIYHPNLVDLNLSGTFGLQQDSTDLNGVSDNEDTTIYEWDTSATILRRELAPLTLYSRRTAQLVNREFGPSLNDTITTEGGIWDIRSKQVPTRFEAYHSEQEQTSLDRTGDFTLSQNSFLWHSDAQPTLNQRLNWDYTFNDVTQSSFAGPTDSFQSNDATLSHNVEFGSRKQSNLASSINYFDQTGTIELEHAHWDESLRLKHTPNLESNYHYTLDQQNTDVSNQTLQRGTAGLRHTLYKSLTSNGLVGIQDISVSDGSETTEGFANLDFDYRKTVPYGVLSANLALGYDYSKSTPSSTITQIANQPATFSDPFPIILTGPNILPGTVLITDPSGLILFQPGFDYTVTQFADHVEISRVVGGGIPNGSSVLLNYQLGPTPGATTSTDTLGVGVRYDIEKGFLRGLGLYARYFRQQQSIDTPNPAALVPNTYNDYVAGADYRVWELFFNAEEQVHDSTIAPFDATRFVARWIHRLSLDTNFSLNSAHTRVNYPDENDVVNLTTVSGSIEHHFSRYLFGSATVLWRYEQDELRGLTQGFEEQAELRWTYRQTSVYGQVRNATLESEGFDSNFLMFLVGFRREF